MKGFLKSVVKIQENIKNNPQIKNNIIQGIANLATTFDKNIQSIQTRQKEINSFNQFIEEYKKNQAQINKLILLSVMSQLKEDIIKVEEVSQKQLEENEKNCLFITEIQEKLKRFLDSQIMLNTDERDQLLFLYFKVTYLFTPEKYEKKYLTSTQSQNLQKLIEFLMKLKEKLNDQVNQKVQEIKDQLENQVDQEIDYETSYKQQEFVLQFQKLKNHKYSNYFKKCQLEDLDQFKLSEGVLKNEEKFLKDLMECFIIYGNMQMIEQYRARKSLLYFQFLDNFFEDESTTNLVKDYDIPFFQYFDKYDFFQILIDSNYIEQLEEDETYLYFLIFTLLNLIKFNYLFINKEQKLQKLIIKISKLKNPKFKLGYTFLLKLMIEFQEKSQLLDANLSDQNDELRNKSTIHLFKEWSNEKYVVSDCYFNKQQLQLYIDGFQSVLILCILPDLVRFYNLEESLPYQPTGLDIGYIQQIIRGKRLYIKYPNKTEENINYWQQLIENMKKIIKQEDYEKRKIRLEKINLKNKTNEQMPAYDQYENEELKQLERKKYNSFKINIQIYISQIDLQVELAKGQPQKRQNKVIFQKESEIGKSQFQIFKVLTQQYGTVVMKQVPDQPKDQQINFKKNQIREISILSNLPQNDYIIKYINHQVNEDSFQLFLEYFEGETLLNYLNKNKPNIDHTSNNNQQEENRVKIEKLKICIEILQAINFLHELNIVHGDLKLANILVCIKNNQIKIKIIDFSESGFMIEKTIGFTEGFEEKSNYYSIYKDFVSVGVMLINLLYCCPFQYTCKSKQDIQCKQSKLHKKDIMMEYKTQFEKTKNNYQKILFKQIMTLFNDQSYLRCSLIELIDLIQIQISIIENENQKQNLLAEYFQKYGEIKTKMDDIIEDKDNQIIINSNDYSFQQTSNCISEYSNQSNIESKYQNESEQNKPSSIHDQYSNDQSSLILEQQPSTLINQNANQYRIEGKQQDGKESEQSTPSFIHDQQVFSQNLFNLQQEQLSEDQTITKKQHTQQQKIIQKSHPTNGNIGTDQNLIKNMFGVCLDMKNQQKSIEKNQLNIEQKQQDEKQCDQQKKQTGFYCLDFTPLQNYSLTLSTKDNYYSQVFIYTYGCLDLDFQKNSTPSNSANPTEIGKVINGENAGFRFKLFTSQFNTQTKKIKINFRNDFVYVLGNSITYTT
ncbi:hypothetical protein ABPG72_014464 [Tetrahymena utriculariae]